ncbi:MAG: sensor histidine kinase [Thiohalomonadales bacterium]
MAVRFIHAVKRSAFLRLLMIFLFSAIILLVLVGAAVFVLNDTHFQIKQKFQHNIVSYAKYLITEIGSPPDYKIAQKLSAEHSLHIKIKSKQGDWKSENYDLPPLLLSEQKKIPDNYNIRIGHNFTYSYIIINKDNFEYIIAISHRKFPDNKGLFILSLILIIIAVTSLNYYLVQWLFRPLRLLDEGVKQVGAGNFDFRVETKRQDEMGELAMAFNQMSEKIQSMMKEKEQLLMDVSHELRSPMTRMKLALEFISDNKPKASIQEDLNQMGRMITELLESARLNNPNSSLSKENIQLNEFLDFITKSYVNSLPGVNFKKLDKALLIYADRDRLQTCIRNIIDNAVKYSKNQSKPVLIEAREKLDKIYITITDFGIGIPVNDQNHIFEPFYRVDKSRNSETGGYGLGLNLCKNIIEVHGGEIFMESTENNITCFTIVLPVK